jgi:hypothetical protein
MEDTKMAKPPSSTTTDTANIQEQQPIKLNNTDSYSSIKDRSNVTKISSLHPRFSTLKILQNFPHIQHCFCHKINVSIPWKNPDLLPNEDTYYQAISYFFNILKTFDSQFQILTWNIHDKDHNPISDVNLIPTTYKDLGSYTYNLHITPSRIKTLMVVTSSFNLSQLVKNQSKASDNQLNHLKKI